MHAAVVSDTTRIHVVRNTLGKKRCTCQRFVLVGGFMLLHISSLYGHLSSTFTWMYHLQGWYSLNRSKSCGVCGITESYRSSSFVRSIFTRYMSHQTRSFPAPKRTHSSSLRTVSCPVFPLPSSVATWVSRSTWKMFSNGICFISQAWTLCCVGEDSFPNFDGEHRARTKWLTI